MSDSLDSLKKEQEALNAKFDAVETQLQKMVQGVTQLNHKLEAVFYIQWDEKTWAIGIGQQFNREKQIESLTFNLYDFDQTHVSSFKPVGELWIGTCYDKTNPLVLNHLRIVHFYVSQKNQGLGSLLLSQSLLWIAWHLGEGTKVRGGLSEQDEQDENNHRRRNHVYEKFGFHIQGREVILEHIDLWKIQNQCTK